MAGTGLYWARGEAALGQLCEELSVPLFLNGLGRGCVPADHPMFFSRARRTGLKDADVALVIGVPLDFRLGFGESFGEETQLITHAFEQFDIAFTIMPKRKTFPEIDLFRVQAIDDHVVQKVLGANR